MHPPYKEPYVIARCSTSELQLSSASQHKRHVVMARPIPFVTSCFHLLLRLHTPVKERHRVASGASVEVAKAQLRAITVTKWDACRIVTLSRDQLDLNSSY